MHEKNVFAYSVLPKIGHKRTFSMGQDAVAQFKSGKKPYNLTTRECNIETVTSRWKLGSGEMEARIRERESHLPDSQLPWLTVTSASICPSPVPHSPPHLSQAGTHISELSNNR